MDLRGWRVGVGLGLALALMVRVAAANAPAAGFTSVKQALPNPDRPYEMTSGTVGKVFRYWLMKRIPPSKARNSSALSQ